MRGIYIIPNKKSRQDVVVRPFVLFVVAFGFGACCTYIGRERGKAPGIHGSIRKRRGLSEQHMRGIYIIFSTGKSVADVVVCLLAVCLVWWLVVVAAFGFWCCTVYTSTEKEARGIHHNVCKRRGSSEQHCTCVVFTLFCQQKALETLLFGRLFGAWLVGVAFGFGAVYTMTSAKRGEAPGIHRGVTQAAGVSEQRIRGINIIFTTKSIGDVIVWPFVWFVVGFGFVACCTFIGRE
jgi:hypothetical protein